MIRFNNHYRTIPWDGISRQGTPLGESLIPHFVGGIQSVKSLLFSPYPAIPPYVVRTPHPGITDDREHITSFRELQSLPSFIKLVKVYKVHLDGNMIRLLKCVYFHRT